MYRFNEMMKDVFGVAVTKEDFLTEKEGEALKELANAEKGGFSIEIEIESTPELEKLVKRFKELQEREEKVSTFIYKAVGIVYKDKVQIVVDKFEVVAKNQRQLVFEASESDFRIISLEPTNFDCSLYLNKAVRTDSKTSEYRYRVTMYLELQDEMYKRASKKVAKALKVELEKEMQDVSKAYKSIYKNPTKD